MYRVPHHDAPVWLCLALPVAVAPARTSTAAMAGFAGYPVLLVRDVLDVPQRDRFARARCAGWGDAAGWQALAPDTAGCAGLWRGLAVRTAAAANAATRDLRNDLLAHLVQLDLASTSACRAVTYSAA